jgi:hypothetical protein
MAQLVRRFLYIVAAISGPMLFDVYTRLPYLLSGGFSVLLSLFVVYKIEKQRRANAKNLARLLRRNLVSLKVMDPRRFSFATQEVLARMGSLANLQAGPEKELIPSRRNSLLQITQYQQATAELAAVYEEDDEEDADDSSSIHGTVPNGFFPGDLSPVDEEDPEDSPAGEQVRVINKATASLTEDSTN